MACLGAAWSRVEHAISARWYRDGLEAAHRIEYWHGEAFCVLGLAGSTAEAGLSPDAVFLDASLRPHHAVIRAGIPAREFEAYARDIARPFPGGAEKISHGRPAFNTTKSFAYYGGSVKVDGAWVEHDQSLLVLPDQSDRTTLLADSRTYVPGLPRQPRLDRLRPRCSRGGLAAVRELIDSSCRNTAATSLVAELDSG